MFFNNSIVTISTYFLKEVLRLQFTLHFYLFFGKIYPILINYPLLCLSFAKKTYKTMGNIFPNFFSKIATESGLLGPRVSL